MATITIRNLPEATVERLKAAAERNCRSMEQELRDLIQERYMSKADAVRRIRDRWPETPETTADEVKRWRGNGRA